MRTTTALACAVCATLSVNGASAASATEELTSYLRANDGRVSAKLRVVQTAAKGRHVVAAEDIAAGDELFHTPWKNVLWAAGTAEQAPERALVLKVLQEKAAAADAGGDRPKTSLWDHYAADLPAAYQTGLQMGEAEMGCLSRSAQNQHRYLLEEFDGLRAKVISSVLYPGDERPVAAITPTEEEEATLRWAFSTVHTRALRMGSGVSTVAVMVPFLDLLNHNSTGSNVGLDYGGVVDASLPALSNGTVDGVVLRATRAVAAGEELFLSYGSHLSPARLLINYGFADSSFAAVNSYLDFPNTPEALPLVQAGCVPTEHTPQGPHPYLLTLNRDGSVPDKTLECIALSIMPPKDRAAYPSLDEAGQKASVEAQRTNALQVYSQHLERVLGLYPSGLDGRCGDSLSALKEDDEAPMLRSVAASNELLRGVYLRARELIAEELREKKVTQKVVTESEEEKARRLRRRKRRRDEQDAEEEEEEKEKE
eukprot:Rhum_TRINITY_DN10337_c0_g1::Rhum_TRINITY_DN10337_c0_g1_i1::g.37960::m.37960